MMVGWQFCIWCGKAVDEYELKCHWCGRPVDEPEEKEKQENEDGHFGE